MPGESIYAVPPTELVRVRTLSHAAVQWPSRAARANLEPLADDGHSNLGWNEDLFGFFSHGLDSERRYRMGFSFSSGSLSWLRDGKLEDTLRLETTDEPGAKAWCDGCLLAAGLQTTDQVEMPYELEPVDYAGLAGAAPGAALATLGAWFSEARTALGGLLDEFGKRAVSAPTIRCWPHHFDLATLFLLDSGDPEQARSVGVGLSPGDSSYAEPYFYCTPWPKPATLPVAVSPLHWHTEGFTSLVCPASRIDERTDLTAVLRSATEMALRILE